MTDEDAFIRAVVDRPGDDTPRLVYADWLDDHDDPARAAYLRAEREAVATGDAAGLRQLAAGVDPVWVARVSRPPVGVCCDRVQFTDSGPLVSPADLDDFERRLGERLPADYRAFLLNTNGGDPDPHDLKSADYPPALDWLTVGRFEPLVPEPPGGWPEPPGSGLDFLAEFVRELAGDDEEVVDGLLPIASTEFDQGYIFLGVRQENYGRVYHFSNFCRAADRPEELIEFTVTLPKLLDLIGRSASYGAVHDGYNL